MGIFGKSKKEKLLDAALLFLNEDKPERDKFLFLYRICQFDLKFNFEDNIDKILNDYKKEPIYPEQYKDLKKRGCHIVKISIMYGKNASIR